MTDFEAPRIIEREMPLTDISAHSAREKSIRHGHLSTLHIWWARRPLAACRAAIFAALLPHEPDARLGRLDLPMQDFIAHLSNWDNSLDVASAVGGRAGHTFIEEARAAIRAHFPDGPPRVLDPFAGGGAIPLEALRLGCESYALDLNPVAHIVQLATLLYPQLYAERVTEEDHRPGAGLVADVTRWGQWVLERVRAEVGDLYASDSRAIPVAYLWARTIPCPRADCAIAVPLIRQTWLSRKAGKFVAYRLRAAGPGQPLRYEVVGPVEEAEQLGFDPTEGTTLAGVATCPACGSPLPKKHIKAEAQAGRLGETLLVVVEDDPDSETRGKSYRAATEQDKARYAEAQRRAATLMAEYDPLSGELAPIPDEPFALNSRYAVPPLYGLDTFGKLFNARQGLVLATFARAVRAAHAEILRATGDADYAKAVATYLGIAVDRLADYNSVICQWQVSGEKIGHTFGRQAIPMTWDFVEINPFSGSTGDWRGAIDWIRRYIEHGAAAGNPAVVQRGSATQQPYPDGFFDAVITDPPYYDNVPYSDLSDFFYVWLRRTVGHLYPTVLGTPLTPKEQEITQDPSKRKSKETFEQMLGEAFAETRRVLKEDGICVVVYAHKAVSAWESLVEALLHAGLMVVGSWPFSTELSNRLRGMNSAALASSIFLVCRKRQMGAGVGLAPAVRDDIEQRVRERLQAFWDAGLRGADFFISAIGPATAAFSRYDRVMDLRGNEITVSTLLAWVQETVADYALARVLQPGGSEGAGLGEVDDPTRFYVLWRWTYDGIGSSVGTAPGEEPYRVAPAARELREGGSDDADAEESADADAEEGEDEEEAPRPPRRRAAPAGNGKRPKVKKIEFGDAHLMATALGADVGDLIHRYHLLEGRSSVRLLYAEERAERLPDLGEPRNDGSLPPLIDVLHRCELLWAKGLQAELDEYLDELTAPQQETLRRVAQALVDLLPRGESEKQRLEGFLYRTATERGDGQPRPSATATQRTLDDSFSDYGVEAQIKRRRRSR